MKSKTCCFNRTIFKKDITHFWPIWLLFFAYLLWNVPVNIWGNLMRYMSWDYTVKEIQYDVLANTFSGGIVATPYFLISVIAAMAVFSYLYTPRTANMFHALPVNRAELFLSNYMAGLFCLLIPEIITFVVAVLLCVGYQITCIQYLFWWLFYVVVITFFAYSMAVFVGMITGQIFAVPVYFVAANFLYIGIRYVLALTLNLICYGIDEGWRPGYSGMLSPWYFLESHLKVVQKYNDAQTLCTGLEFTGRGYLAVYAVAAVFCILGAWMLYRKRQIETAGDIISVNWVKPIFRWGIALAGGSLMTIFIVNMICSVKQIPIFSVIVAGIIFWGFVFFFVAEMFLVKGFRVITKKRMAEWAVFTVLAVTFFGIFRLDIFGMEKRVPDAKEVREAFLYLDYPVAFDEENMEELLAIHRGLIEKKDEYRNLDKSKVPCVTILYYLKDGDYIQRRYPIPLDEESVYDEEGLLAELVEVFQNPENVVAEKLGWNYETNKYMSASVELFDENCNVVQKGLDESQTEELVQALIADIREGNLYNIADNYDSDHAAAEYANGISLSIFNEDSVLVTSDYYYNYNYYRISSGRVSTSGEIYLSFNERCSHIRQALEKSGVLTEDSKLYTYEELEAVSSTDFGVD